MQDHTKLLVWQKARVLTIAVHEAAQRISDRKAPGIRPQIIRAVMSISANVAEGTSRDTRADFARFVSIAIGSVTEIEHHLTVCVDLNLLDHAVAALLIERTVEVRRMLFGLRRVLVMRVSEEQALYTAFSPRDSRQLH